MSYYLAIVDRTDAPIYELEFGTSRQGADGVARFAPGMKELNPFIVNAALDVVEDMQWTNPALYLKAVDNFYTYMVSAFVTAGNIRFLLLHESKNDEPIRQFFADLYDLYVKTLMSPFYEAGAPIKSAAFDARVRACVRKYL